MMRFVPIMALAVCYGVTAQAGFPKVPSNQMFELFQEGVLDEADNGRVYYLGLIAPEIAKGARVGYEAANKDIDVLCEHYALAKAMVPKDGGTPAHEVIIRLMDRAVEYGEVNPAVRQYMGFFDISKGTCVWH
ncbi:MAG: hypothetical protein COB84_06010 [Rhodobacteraceae bacterium]|nr:MAG: hypothetical protein COB84_06010 [Paracoccaceae bacterium]